MSRPWRRPSVALWSAVVLIGAASLALAFAYTAASGVRPAMSKVGIPVVLGVGIATILFLQLGGTLARQDFRRRIERERSRARALDKEYQKTADSFRSKFGGDDKSVGR